jgi:hypothetical protein
MTISKCAICSEGAATREGTLCDKCWESWSNPSSDWQISAKKRLERSYHEFADARKEFTQART